MVPYDWVISFKPGPVLLGLVFKGESCDSGRGWNSHLTQVRKVVVTLDLLSSYLGAGSLVCSSVTLQCLKRLFITYIRLFLELFLDLAELGPCLALGIWCLLCLLQSSTLRLHTSSHRFPAGWPHRRSSSPGLCSATSSCAVTCRPSPANRLCYWPLSPQDNMLRISVSQSYLWHLNCHLSFIYLVLITFLFSCKKKHWGAFIIKTKLNSSI